MAQKSRNAGQGFSGADLTLKRLDYSHLIGDALPKTNWNRKKAAQLLDNSYRSLLSKIKEYQIGQ